MPRIDPVLGFALPPPPDADRLTQLLYTQDDVLSRRQALRLLSQKTIRHRLESGRWQVAHAGIYVAHSGPITCDQRRWVAVLAAGGGRCALLGGLSALEMFGPRGQPSQRFHVVIPASRRDDDPPPGVVVHRTRTLTPRDIHRVGAPPSTTRARSVIDAAQWAATDEGARLVVAAAFQQCLVSYAEIEAALSRLQRVRRRSLIMTTAADAQDGSHSVGELDFLRLCRRRGLPSPSRQLVRLDARGGRRYLDALFEEWQVQVEIDGAQHLELEQWWADQQRQNDLWVAGLRILRFPTWVIRERPDEVAAQVRAALLHAGWRPAPADARPWRPPDRRPGPSRLSPPVQRARAGPRRRPAVRDLMDPPTRRPSAARACVGVPCLQRGHIGPCRPLPARGSAASWVGLLVADPSLGLVWVLLASGGTASVRVGRCQSGRGVSRRVVDGGRRLCGLGCSAWIRRTGLRRPSLPPSGRHRAPWAGSGRGRTERCGSAPARRRGRSFTAAGGGRPLPLRDGLRCCGSPFGRNVDGVVPVGQG